MALENKLGITNSADLAREEKKISKKKAAELFEKGLIDKSKAVLSRRLLCFTYYTSELSKS